MQGFDGSFDEFRLIARAALTARRSPASLHLIDDRAVQPSLSLFAKAEVVASAEPLRVSKSFLRDAELAALHANADRWQLLYRLMYRRTFEEPNLFHMAADPDVRALALLVSAVSRDIHKMHAFVRFRRSEDVDGSSAFVAFYESDHRVAARAMPLFIDRYGEATLVVATPYATLRWQHGALSEEPGTTLAHFRERWPEVAADSEITALFGTYFSNVFNPARLNERAMRAEMPVRFWKHLPEAQLIPGLVAAARARTQTMTDRGTTATIAVGASLPVIAAAARACSVCPHAAHATDAVTGHGPEHARLVLIGEQPGDEEDRRGLPFIGPAGMLLRELLLEAEIDVESVYLTNAVKHFTWEPRGKQRLHKKPSYTSVKACHPLLVAELRAVRPEVIVCLGVTAAQSLLGSGFRLAQARDKLVPQPWSNVFIATYHPSAIFRATPDEAPGIRSQLLADLRRARALTTPPPSG